MLDFVVQTFRKIDDAQGDMVVDFLCKYIYPQIYDTAAIKNTAYDTQIKGIDIILPDGNHDVKAQLKQYINNPTPTFSLEIIGKSINYPGWFINPQSLTDFYDLVWINDADITGFGFDARLISLDGIHDLEVAVVPKKRLYTYFSQMGISSRELLDTARSMRQLGIKETYVKQFKLVQSINYAEQPVNLILRKNIHIELSKFYIRYNNGILTVDE